MKIYTSYFGNLKRLKADGIVPVGIARFPPKWFGGLNYQKPAPMAFMLIDNVTEAEYISLYIKYVTDRLDARVVVRELEQLTHGRDCALLCYEKPDDFCHRHLFADWLSSKIGEPIEEYPYLKEKPKNVQTSLF